ncbi:hypothetical protein D3C81_2111040 [compost metagenome]
MYRRVYTPGTAVSTWPVTTMVADRSPSTLSVAAAPRSVNTLPAGMDITASPFSVMTGFTVSGTGVVSPGSRATT